MNREKDSGTETRSISTHWLIPSLHFRPITIFFFKSGRTPHWKTVCWQSFIRKKTHFIDINTDSKCNRNEQGNPSLVSVKRKNPQDVKGTFVESTSSPYGIPNTSRAPTLYVPPLHQHTVWAAHRAPLRSLWRRKVVIGRDKGKLEKHNKNRRKPGSGGRLF